jgi:hypothetical protein
MKLKEIFGKILEDFLFVTDYNNYAIEAPFIIDKSMSVKCIIKKESIILNVAIRIYCLSSSSN